MEYRDPSVDANTSSSQTSLDVVTLSHPSVYNKEMQNKPAFS